MKNKVSIFDWYLYKKGYDTLLPFIISMIIKSGSILSFFLLLRFSSKLALLSLFVLLPIIILSIIIDKKYFNSKIMEEYQQLNRSYKYKGKYYSAWYIVLNKRDNNFRELISTMNNWVHKDVFLNEDQNIISNLDMGASSSLLLNGEIDEYKRKSRKHWKNNIETNRLLTYIEFLRYKKNKLKIEEANQNIREIEEFQNYYNLK